MQGDSGTLPVFAGTAVFSDGVRQQDRWMSTQGLFVHYRRGGEESLGIPLRRHPRVGVAWTGDDHKPLGKRVLGAAHRSFLCDRLYCPRRSKARTPSAALAARTQPACHKHRHAHRVRVSERERGFRQASRTFSSHMPAFRCCGCDGSSGRLPKARGFAVGRARALHGTQLKGTLLCPAFPRSPKVGRSVASLDGGVTILSVHMRHSRWKISDYQRAVLLGIDCNVSLAGVWDQDLIGEAVAERFGRSLSAQERQDCW